MPYFSSNKQLWEMFKSHTHRLVGWKIDLQIASKMSLFVYSSQHSIILCASKLPEKTNPVTWLVVITDAIL